MNTRIKEYREKFNMSQEELAEKSHVSRSTISNLETKKQNVVSTDTMKKIADVFKVKPSTIFMI